MKDPLSLQTHEYGQITKWTVSRDGKVFAYSLEDAAIVYLVSALAPAIEASVERYVVALLAKQKGKAESHRKALSAAEKAKAPTLLGEAEGRPHHFAIGGSAATAHAPPTTIEEGDEGVGEEAGDIYYVNDITGESRWDPPEAEEATQLLPGWERVEDDDGDVFYVNAETGESQWDPPLAGAEEAGEVGGGVDFGGEPEETTEDELGPLPDGWAKVGPDEE
ncbi:ITCH, partial [Symbiodinium sp. KB8]